MNTMADGAAQRLVAQIGEALFGQPGLTLMELAEKVKGMKVASSWPEPACSGGFVISDGSGEKYMAWGQVGPEWVADRSAALWLVRRADAEALAAENEDAWSILPVERCALPPSGWACTLEVGHEGPCPTIAVQPSPAGQRGSLATLAANWRARADEYDENAREADSIGDMTATVQYLETKSEVLRQVAEELEAALAARQPVGEEPVGYRWRHSAGEKWQYSHIPCGWEYEPLYAAPPAQEVDMGAMPDGWRLSKKATCYQLSNGNDIVGNLVGPDAEENAAIIARILDSKAVGK
ncbi:hypothetical protein [Stenotrophomonas maltophilia]|uniref:hypothetical protein n=1 Tax=Stenotrophomonas maltophilia TaxID=40324 RepID=UPI0013DC150E|nr:hypothetical protein [Stenotrophomonas maltophilia]